MPVAVKSKKDESSSSEGNDNYCSFIFGKFGIYIFKWLAES